MLCPYCGEGPLYRARFRPNGESLCICAECDTVWVKTDSGIKVTNYASYSETLGQPPLWDQLQLRSVLERGKALP